LIIGLIAPQLVKCIVMLVNEFPAAMESFIPKLEKIGIVPDDIINSLASIDWKSRIGDIVSAVGTGLGGAVDIAFTAVSSVFSGVTNLVIGFIFAVYLLIEKDKLIAQFKKLMKRFVPEEKGKKINYVWAEISDCFHDFIVGQCTEAVILGVLCMAGMFILRIPYAPMIGALMGFTALIPIVGGLIGAGVGAFLILVEDPIKALIFIIFVIVLQQVEGNLIYPKVVGKSLGLPGIWVLAAVTVGGGVMGIGGMLIGVPLAAAAYRLLKAYINTPKEEITQPIVEENTDNA
ncbi:MAG: AI-2E family transporter, partial [Clostridia bacterium]|nr:AI-2E family transporter [Clostridia bacterium]